MSIPHLPALRKGVPYESLDKIDVKDHARAKSLPKSAKSTRALSGVIWRASVKRART